MTWVHPRLTATNPFPLPMMSTGGSRRSRHNDGHRAPQVCVPVGPGGDGVRFRHHHQVQLPLRHGLHQQILGPSAMVKVALEEFRWEGHYCVVSMVSSVGPLLPPMRGVSPWLARLDGLSGMVTLLPLRAGALQATPPHRWAAPLPWSLQTGQLGFASHFVAVWPGSPQR